MKVKDLEARLRGDASLPMLPQVVVKVQKVVSADDSSASDLANVILSDPSLTSRVLRVVNSAFYGASRQKITRVTQAIVVLGFEKVRGLAFVLSSYKILRNLAGGKMIKEYWLHSLATACASQSLAQRVAGNLPPEEAFVAGLLHDVGKLILSHYDPVGYKAVLEKVAAGTPYREAEKEVFDLDHCEAGLALARTWRFPHLVEVAIRHHHDLEAGNLKGDDRDAMAIVGVANLIALNLYGRKSERRSMTAEGVARIAADLLGLSNLDLEELSGSIGKMVEDVASNLGISIAGMKRYAEKGYEQAMLSDDDTALIQMDQQLSLERRRLQAMFQITEMLSRNPPFEEFLGKVLVLVCESFEFERAFFASVHHKDGRIRGTAAHGPQAIEISPKIQVPLEPGGGVIARTVLEDRPYNIIDVFNTDLSILGDDRLDMLFGTKNLVTIPVHAGGLVVAVLILNNCQRTTLASASDIEALQTMANQIGFAIEKARLQARESRPHPRTTG